MPRAKVIGKAVIAGVEYCLDGFGFVSKNVSNFSPHKLARTFHHCKFVTPELTLAMCKIETPKAFDSACYSWGFLVDEGRLVAATTRNDGRPPPSTFFSFPFVFFFLSLSHTPHHTLSFTAVWLQPGVLDPETKYVTPTKVQFKWEGTAADGRPFSAEVVVDVKRENLLCRFDVLGHIPAIFRFSSSSSFSSCPLVLCLTSSFLLFVKKVHG